MSHPAPTTTRVSAAPTRSAAGAPTRLDSQIAGRIQQEERGDAADGDEHAAEAWSHNTRQIVERRVESDATGRANRQEEQRQAEGHHQCANRSPGSKSLDLAHFRSQDLVI
jgi:hypothetical protein